MARVAQTSSASKQRLERISHHYLSEPAERAAPSGNRSLLLPVLPMPGVEDFPLVPLTQALLARGRSSVVLDPRRGVRTATRPDPSEPSHPDASVPPAARGGGGGPAFALGGVAEAAAALKPPPDLALVPVALDDWPLPDGFGRLLLAVPARQDGVREAYRALKRLAAAGHRGPVGAVITDAPDETSARLHFDKLAEGALRFLELEVHSYGCLPAPPGPHAAVDLLGPGPESLLATALEGVARLICHDLVPGETAPAATA
jgi:hypothetical protein